MANSRPLAYYVHHHGTGHLRRATQIIDHIQRPVFLLSALPKPENLPSHVTYVELPSDIVTDYTQPSGTVFHYTPYGRQIFTRNQILIDTWQKYDIRDIYVDVSIEVAVLAKLYGLSVGHAVMHGVRTDPAHTYGYQAVDYLLAHFAEQYDTPENHPMAAPLFYSGGISRFKKRPVAQLNSSVKQIVVTSSPVSTHQQTKVLASAVAYPDITWHTVGSPAPKDNTPPNLIHHGVIEDPSNFYAHADMIIGSGGNNTIMEIASFGKPFLCIPENRPYGEQVAAARSLQNLNAALYVRKWPANTDWPAIFEARSSLDLQACSSLVSDTAAAQAARIIESNGRPGS